MSHRAFTQLTGAGVSEEQTEALFEVYGDGKGSFATREDLHGFATKADLQGGLQALELRLTLRFGALAVAGVAVLAALDRL